jgi:hypothetical protein
MPKEVNPVGKFQPLIALKLVGTIALAIVSIMLIAKAMG